jgi:hypothetical protein
MLCLYIIKLIWCPIYKIRLWRSTSFVFFRNGKLIEENEKYILKGSNTELTVRNIINKDGGSYVCKATNKAGEDQKQAFLQVFGKYHSTEIIMQYPSKCKDVRANLPSALRCKL